MKPKKTLKKTIISKLAEAATMCVENLLSPQENYLQLFFLLLTQFNGK